MEENHATLNATKFEEYIQGSSGEVKDGGAENYTADGGIFMQIEVEGEDKSQEVLLELINTAGERISAQELSSIEALKHLILPDTLSVKIENSNSPNTENCHQNEKSLDLLTNDSEELGNINLPDGSSKDDKDLEPTKIECSTEDEKPVNLISNDKLKGVQDSAKVKTRKSSRLVKKENEEAKYEESKCKICDKVCKGSQGLSLHLRKHADGVKGFVCPHCGVVFEKKKDKTKHCDKVHNSYICSECGKVLSTLYSLQIHEQTHGEYQRLYKCENCDKEFRFKADLKVHRRTHTDERPFQCTVCDKKFRLGSHLKNHMFTHSDLDPEKLTLLYLCEVCGKLFAQQGNLLRHLKVHFPSKTHVCFTCGSAFNTNADLKQHQLKHSDVRPYKCLHCDKAFKTQRHLNEHAGIHAERKPHVCPHCEKRFTQKANLYTHMKTACKMNNLPSVSKYDDLII